MTAEQVEVAGMVGTFDRLVVRVYPDRRDAGRTAAQSVAERMRLTIRQKGQVRMVFAAAPSQIEFLEELTAAGGIEWSAVTAFHMDEYLGLRAGHPHLASTFLDQHLFGKVSFGGVFTINPEGANPLKECRRYGDLLRREPVDIVCLGIGEHGQLALNDPPVADVNDREIIKVVELGLFCRQQQVHEGSFPDLASVPTHAITLTIPTLMAGAHLSCVVPGTRKARAVGEALEGPVDVACPASILRIHADAVLYLDRDSSSEIL